MLNLMLAFIIAGGLDVHDWYVMSSRQARVTIGKMPFWDYNETCVAGRDVKFSGEHMRFNEREIRAWNTAILFAVEDGIIPSFIGDRAC